jgi:hypothetical protein
MLRGGHKAPKRNRLWLAAWLAPVCPITAGVSSAQLTQAVAWAGCSALKSSASNYKQNRIQPEKAATLPFYLLAKIPVTIIFRNLTLIPNHLRNNKQILMHAPCHYMPGTKNGHDDLEPNPATSQNSRHARPRRSAPHPHAGIRVPPQFRHPGSQQHEISKGPKPARHLP